MASSVETSGPTAPLRWRQVPPTVAPDRSWEAAMLAWVLTALPMAVQFARLQYTAASFVPALLAALVVALLVRLHWFVGLVGAAVAVPAVMLRDSVFAGPPVLLMLAVLLLWTVATGAFRPGWRRWPSSPARRLVGLAMLVVSALLLLQTGVRLPVLAVGVAVLAVLVCLAAPGPVGRAMSRTDPLLRAASPVVRFNGWLLAKVGHVLGTVLGVVAMLPVALLTLVVWAVQRLVRFDPLAPPVHEGTRWVERTGDDAEPGRSFAKVTVRETRSVGDRVRRLTASVLSVAVLALLLFSSVFSVRLLLAGESLADVAQALARRVPSAFNCRSGPDAVMDGQPSWPLVGCETSDFVASARFDGTTGFRYEDVAGKWVNVTDGVRPTWQPPPCDCRRLTVWWFGGSAAWGFYQGDMESVPSQVAKAAWEQGIALDIVNYATPGWTLGQSVRKFAQLSATEPPPDLAVFMDGVNDLTVQFNRNYQGAGADESEASFVEGALDTVLRYGKFDGGVEKLGISIQGSVPPVPNREVGQHAVRRLARNVKVGQNAAAAAGTTAVFFLQPILVSAPARVGADNAMPPRMRRELEQAWPEVRRGLPDGMLDLSDVFDDVDRKVYKDHVHVNEYGAGVLAQQMFTELRPAVAAAAAAPPRN